MVPLFNVDWVTFSSAFTAVVVASVALFKAIKILIGVFTKARDK